MAPQTEATELIASSVLMASATPSYILQYGESGKGGGPR